MQEDQRKYDRLFQQIMERLNSKRVESKNEETSMYDVVESVYNEMYIYNLILLNNLGKRKKKLNEYISSPY